MTSYLDSGDNIGPMAVAVMGPTASGKTRLAVALAREIGAELVNADSRQAIAELSIGVCKPTSEELSGVVCHGLMWSHLGRPFSVAEYRAQAAASVENVIRRGRTAIVVGGTGLYVRALFSGFDFGAVAPTTSRGVGGESAKEDGPPAMAAARELRCLDPERATLTDMNNPRRVNRALELARAGAHPSHALPTWDAVKLGCRVSPPALRRRIESRSDQLMANPLLTEVRELQSLGFSKEVVRHSAIGYAEALDWSEGRCQRDEAVERVVVRTWRYAKAQMTWLRSEPNLVWVDAEESSEAMVDQCIAAMEAAQPARVG